MTDYHTLELFDSSNIDRIEWPNSDHGAFAKNFLTPLIKEGVEKYFDNIKTTLFALKIDDFVIPLTLNDKQYDNSYVCSFYSYYIHYGLISLNLMHHMWGFNKLLKGFLRTLGALLKGGKINKVVSVNNWLFSTNLLPDLSQHQIQRITGFLKERFPDHAIAFRSVHTFENKQFHHHLRNMRFDLIASRQVYFTNPRNEEVFSTRIFKSDLKLLKETDYETVKPHDISINDASKLLSLYNAIYVNKYAAVNPQVNANFVKMAIENNIMTFHALKKEGSIDGVVGYYKLHGTMTSPFFGYDNQKPQNAGLYRILSTILSLEAKQHDVIFHQGAGASFYKTVRRAEPNMEYIAVYNKHLPIHRRFVWLTLKAIMNGVGVKFMKKY